MGSLLLPSGNLVHAQNEVIKNEGRTNGGRQKARSRHSNMDKLSGWNVSSNRDSRLWCQIAWGLKLCFCWFLITWPWTSLSFLIYIMRIIILCPRVVVLIEWVNTYECLEECLAHGKHSVYVSSYRCWKCGEFLECQSLTFKYKQNTFSKASFLKN